MRTGSGVFPEAIFYFNNMLSEADEDLQALFARSGL